MGDLPHIIFLGVNLGDPGDRRHHFSNEAAHGFVANLFGDDTALRLGRAIAAYRSNWHVGTILLPGLLLLNSLFLFGYARPVPVNFDRLGRSSESPSLPRETR